MIASGLRPRYSTSILTLVAIATVVGVLFVAWALRARVPLDWLFPWLAAQIVVMPVMGMPLFSGSVSMATGSLVGHLVYGAVLGVVYGYGWQDEPMAAPA